MRILFLGTPDFAVPSLKALLDAGHEICGVITQPDKPKNRGMKLQEPPVKQFALAAGLPVFQPETMKDEAAYDLIAGLAPEIAVVTAYGKILPERILNIPPRGFLNVHSSLLPRYRGAAPINWAILNGDRETGVSIMYLVKALDAGDVLAREVTPIDPDETAGELYARLAEMGGGLLCRTIGDILSGSEIRTPQDEALATYAPMLSKDLSPMDWTRPARQLHDQVRGLLPWPAAITAFCGVRCKVLDSKVSGEHASAAPGTVLQSDRNGIRVCCGDGSVLVVTALQPDGGKRLDAGSYLNGHSVPAGTVCRL